jgi:hypothetical protein
MPTKGFWQTVPGLLTGTAAVLTAIGGLLAVLFQMGVLGAADSAPPQASDTTTPSIIATTASPVTATASADASSAAGGWESATAIMTANNGKKYTSRADTFRYCVSAGAGVYFDNAQNIAFENMVTLEVLRSDVALSTGGRADVRITLTSGKVLTGTIDAGCDFIMQAEAGRVNLYPDKVKKIEFVRP